MLDYLIGFGKIIASSVSTRTKAVLLNIVGSAGDASGGDGDEAGETAANQDHYTALGLVFRPRPPTKKDGVDQYAEPLFIRTGDGLVPFAYRDLRLNEFFPAPKEASITWVGYAGAFDANEASFESDEPHRPKSSVRTTYVPYAFQNGVPTKAHTITIDGTAGNESISIVHGDGMAVLMKHGGKNSIVIKNKAGNAYVEVNDDGVTANGNLVVTGGASIGSPTAAVAVALAPPLIGYITALETLLGTISGATVPTTSPAVATFLTATAAVKAAIAATLAKAL
jgi:hypothetical protein